MFYKNVKLKCFKLWFLFSFCIVEIHGSTHWIVTEGGLIQPKSDSPFELAHPYDLLAFLNQDTRWQNIHNIYHDLIKRQHVIKTLWAKLERGTDVPNMLSQEKHCKVIDQINMMDWYTSFLDDGKSRIDSDEFFLEEYDNGHTDVPDCKKISSLTFSMFVFEHLQALRERGNLNAGPEMTMADEIVPYMGVDQLGHWVAGRLKDNSTSWLHYNMASLFWRAKGVIPKALECSRRAIHYAPRRYKDIALLSMGITLHRSRMTEDALIVLGAAADHDPKSPMNNYILANALAINGDYNTSVKYFDIAIKLHRTFDLAKKHKSGVLCHKYVLKKMRVVQKHLKYFREEISYYIQKEAYSLNSQITLLRTMKHPEGYDFIDLEKNYARLLEITGINFKELKVESDKYALVQYFLDGPTYAGDWLNDTHFHALEAAYNLQRLVQHITRHANMIVDPDLNDKYVKLPEAEIIKEIGPTPTFTELVRDQQRVKSIPVLEIKVINTDTPKQNDNVNVDENLSEFETGIILYPTTLKISRNAEAFDKEAEWPTNRLCKETANTFPDNFDAIYQVFLPFENKGIRLRSLLTDKIGVSAQTEHELPWHPPVCPNDKDVTAFTQKKSQKPNIATEVIDTGYLRQKLLEYLGDGDAESVKHVQEAEIGQRIYASMQMDLAPKWLLYTLSSLYWRVRGNVVNALHCTMSAVKIVENRYKDIVLVSLASIYLEMGYFDEALIAAEEAFKLNLYEPATNFILAELNMIKKHRNTHMFHLKQVLRVEPNFMNGLARSLLHGWACLFKQVNMLHELDINEGDICTQVEPGMSMVCEKDGSNCHLSNIKCFRNHEKDSSSALFRMVEIKDEYDDIPEVVEVNEHVFEHFVRNLPFENTDKKIHQRTYDAMMKTVDKALKGCGIKGCHRMKAVDLELTEEECTDIDLEHASQFTNFPILLSKLSPRLPLDIVTMHPSNNKYPECRMNINPSEDFYLEKFLKIDQEGWEPLLTLMHEYAEMFDFYDYVSLGAKLSKFVENNADSWWGAAAAGWWCGTGGRGDCAVRCFALARARAPPALASHPARALISLLHLQEKYKDAKELAYLSFYEDPKSKVEAMLVGITHTHLKEFEPAVWMFRYALTFDEKFLPAKACLHATVCIMLYGDLILKKSDPGRFKN